VFASKAKSVAPIDMSRELSPAADHRWPIALALSHRCPNTQARILARQWVDRRVKMIVSGMPFSRRDARVTAPSEMRHIVPTNPEPPGKATRHFSIERCGNLESLRPNTAQPEKR
jgi:hypothetical protein